MRRTLPLTVACGVFAVGANAGTPEIFDRVEHALHFATHDGALAGRLSGTIDFEAYSFGGTPPGFIDTESNVLANPRLSVFLDAQAGKNWYFFAQARFDRGFDPGNEPARARLDEYALRFTADGAGRGTVQVGKFATIVGNWPARHGSWSDGFITAPLPYSGSTPMWDQPAVHSSGTLFNWAHLDEPADAEEREEDRYRRIPLIWGPAYAHGAAISWTTGRLETQVELKAAPLSSRPAAWRDVEPLWQHPTVNAHVGYRPNPAWGLGLSASTGPYLWPFASAAAPTGRRPRDYREDLLGADVSFAWHHWQCWAEVFAARFTIPGVGDANVTSGYVEARYRFSPLFSAGLRWSGQAFGSLALPAGGSRRWGYNLSRWEFAPAFRLSSNVQLKLQFSQQPEDDAARQIVRDVAGQLTLRF